MSPSDPRIRTERATVPSPNGNGSIEGLLVRPVAAGTERLPSILVIHENRGLNPHIEDFARCLALENFMTFAPDGLTSVGGYPGDDEAGGALFRKVDRAKMGEDLHAAAVWLKGRADSSGRLGVTGFCFGGGVSNALAVRMGADLHAAAPYYGGAPPVEDVPNIRAAVLVHHGGEDARLVMAWPAYEAALRAAGVTYEGPHLSLARAMASITTPRRRGSTRPRPTRPGRAPSPGSTCTCARRASAGLRGRLVAASLGTRSGRTLAADAREERRWRVRPFHVRYARQDAADSQLDPRSPARDG